MSRALSIGALADVVEPGDLVYLPGGVTTPVPFIEELQREIGRSRGLRVLTSIAPGIDNPLDLDRLDETAVVTGLFMQPSLTQAQRTGRYRALPVSYGGFVRQLRESEAIDLVVVQVTPPDAAGRCSLGPSVEFTPLALHKARRVLALVNSDLPRFSNSVDIPFDRFDHVCDVGGALPVYQTNDDAPTRAIADHIAALVKDGGTLQMGLGKVPTALAAALRGHRRLRLFSGMLSDGLMNLSEAGALDSDFMHTCCVAAGSLALYQWADKFERLRIAGCETTHDARTLGALEGFIAVNSALEVDLFGQCNLEHADGRAVSGAGGAPDFARAARLSPGGCSIVALNASYSSRKRGLVSRIVPRLPDPGVASLSRVDIDCIITEFGTAELRGASVHERAEAIIAVAAPECRDDLQRAWSGIAAQL